jgi:hypothetical protein
MVESTADLYERTASWQLITHCLSHICFRNSQFKRPFPLAISPLGLIKTNYAFQHARQLDRYSKPNSMASSPTTHLNPNPIPEQDAPSTSVNIYRRCFKGRKHLFAPSDSSEAQYFVTNPVPHKHRNSWKPIFYRGDNPKYTPSTAAIGMARRSAMWGSFDVQLGEGAQELLENKKRRKAKRSAARQAKWRKAFRMCPKPPKEPLEEEQEVVGR